MTTDDDIIPRLQRVLCAACDDPDLVIAADLPCDWLPVWDSLIRVTVAVELEGEFQVRIASQQMEDAVTVGDIASLIRSALLASRPGAGRPDQRPGHAV